VRLPIDASEVAALRLGVYIRGVARIGEYPEAIASVQILPLRLGDATRVLRLAGPRAVVLQPAVDLVRPVVVDAYVIELRDRQCFRFPPLVSRVVRVPQPAVVTHDEMIGVAWIDLHFV